MTAQIYEKLILNGEEASMAFCPPLPENDTRVIELKDDEIFSTACWRQYVGTWEIKDDKFYLVGLEGGKYKLSGTAPVFADWFTGMLRIPQGEMLHYVHMGFGSVFEQEAHMKIEKGIVIKSKTTDTRNKNVSEGGINLEDAGVTKAFNKAYTKKPQYNLRSSYCDLSVLQVQSLSHISIRSKECWGFEGHSTISHNYVPKTISGDRVVIDNATGLMWHQSGSTDKFLGHTDWMMWHEAKEWVRDLNYAGYSDWRLPTVEEGALLLGEGPSLLAEEWVSSSKMNSNLFKVEFIDTVFDKKPCIWTGDKKDILDEGLENAWIVDFQYGNVNSLSIGRNFNVSPVRSMK